MGFAVEIEPLKKKEGESYRRQAGPGGRIFHVRTDADGDDPVSFIRRERNLGRMAVRLGDLHPRFPKLHATRLSCARRLTKNDWIVTVSYEPKAVSGGILTLDSGVTFTPFRGDFVNSADWLSSARTAVIPPSAAPAVRGALWWLLLFAAWAATRFTIGGGSLT